MKSHVNICTLLCMSACALLQAEDKITAFRTGDELIVKLDRFDLLRQQHSELNAVLQLTQNGKDKELVIDLADPAVQGALVIDLAKFGKCDGITTTIKDGKGQVIARQVVSPIPEIPLQPMKATTQAYIEPGSAMRREQQVSPPKIALPDLKQLRQIKLTTPNRTLTKKEITFPIVAEVDYPIVGGAVVGRQTAAPDDPAKVSLYLTCKKAIYDGTRLERWQKFLIEVPVQESWGAGQGDETITLRPDQFEVHITNERSPRGANILNNKEGDLGQLGEMDTDDEGRIYWRIDGGGGAYVVRFNPHTKKFEQPPAQVDFQHLVPPGAGMLNDGICKVACTRGRVYFTMCLDTRTSGDPKNMLNRRIGGVFSIPQDWSDAAAFTKDVRLHVGSWETAQPALYKTPPKADVVERKLGGASITDTGLFIVTAEAKYEGGPWRLDLDEKGNTKFFGTVKALTDSVASDGTALPPSKIVTVKGIPKAQEISAGPGGGRSLVDFKYGEVTMPRGSVRLLTQGLEGVTLIKISKHVSTYTGAPQGALTIKYDLVEKLRSHPDAQGPLADSLSSGSSMGPAFLLSPIPRETSKVMAVCEYAGYPLSVLDFSHIADRKTVGKRSLPPAAPARTGLGPYNSIWVKHEDEQWLYFSGYTGISRIQYSKGGKVLPQIAADVISPRLSQAAVDGHGRTSMKKVDGLLHIFGGRLLDSGFGLDGRGGDAYSTGLELFDPQQLNAERTRSQTSAHLSRCFALKTLQSRMVWNAQDGSRHQEVFAASGSVRRQMINELNDPSIAPTNLDAKIFLYDVSEKDGLRDLYGFSLPKADDDRAVSSHIVLSPCHRFLIIMTQDGVLYSYSIAQRQFIDGAMLQGPSSDARLMEFKRPSQIIFTSPDGQIFFLTEPFEQDGTSINFHRVIVADNGRLGIEPHIGITFDASEGWQDFKGIVRCFLPDQEKNDGSYDFILGYSQSTVQPFVRVITDFVSPTIKNPQ